MTKLVIIEGIAAKDVWNSTARESFAGRFCASLTELAELISDTVVYLTPSGCYGVKQIVNREQLKDNPQTEQECRQHYTPCLMSAINSLPNVTTIISLIPDPVNDWLRDHVLSLNEQLIWDQPLAGLSSSGRRNFVANALKTPHMIKDLFA